MTRLLFKKNLDEVVSLLLDDEVVAFPTDTVFGIGVLYDRKKAVEKMRKVKGREASKPFPLMVATVEQLEQVAHVAERERKIARGFMPGALTLVLRRKESIRKESVNGFDTVAVRIPDDRFVLKLLRKVGPMFVSSANLSGLPAANSHQEVLQQLENKIAAVVRGKSSSHVASTIIDCSGENLVCLREGTISFEEVEKYAGQSDSGNN